MSPRRRSARLHQLQEDSSKRRRSRRLKSPFEKDWNELVMDSSSVSSDSTLYLADNCTSSPLDQKPVQPESKLTSHTSQTTDGKKLDEPEKDIPSTQKTSPGHNDTETANTDASSLPKRSDLILHISKAAHSAQLSLQRIEELEVDIRRKEECLKDVQTRDNTNEAQILNLNEQVDDLRRKCKLRAHDREMCDRNLRFAKQELSSVTARFERDMTQAAASHQEQVGSLRLELQTTKAELVKARERERLEKSEKCSVQKQQHLESQLQSARYELEEQQVEKAKMAREYQVFKSQLRSRQPDLYLEILKLANGS